MTKPERRCDTYAWQKRWRVERERGLKRTTGPERAQEHVQGLIREYGVTSRAIAEAADISRTLLNHLERGICTGLFVTSEQKILGVRPQHLWDRLNPTSWVPITGSKRRIQALHAIGWRHVDINPRLGFDARTVSDARKLITKRKHDAITRVYDQLWNQPGPSDKGRRRAAKLGYAPPVAWDDETIDDPAAVPDLGAKVSNLGMTAPGTIRKTDAVIEDVEFLLEEGLDWDALTTRLDVNPKTLDTMLHRRGRADLINRGKNMAERRAYARAS